MSIQYFFTELNRRGVFRVGGAYLVSAWAIAKIAELAMEQFGAPDWGLQAVLICLIIGFPVVLALAWMHDLSTLSLDLDLGDGVESTEARINPAGHASGRKVAESDISSKNPLTSRLLLGVGLTAVLLIAGSFWFFATDSPVSPERTADQKSIVVLPFVSLSPNTEDEYFSDGISEELLNTLSKIPRLRVISRSTAFSYKGRNVDGKTIAEELGVGHILEGSVRKAGDQVRINAQLVQTSTDTPLWSETYTRQLDNSTTYLSCKMK